MVEQAHWNDNFFVSPLCSQLSMTRTAETAPPLSLEPLSLQFEFAAMSSLLLSNCLKLLCLSFYIIIMARLDYSYKLGVETTGILTVRNVPRDNNNIAVFCHNQCILREKLYYKIIIFIQPLFKSRQPLQAFPHFQWCQEYKAGVKCKMLMQQRND